jgi:P pilus assembly chaperone PapD
MSALKRWGVPVATLGAMAGLLAATQFIPAAVAPPETEVQSSARVGLICPYLSSESTQWRIVAASEQGQLLSSALDAKPSADPTDLLKLTGGTEATRVTAPGSDSFSAVGWVAQGVGPDVGMSAVACVEPTASTWFAGAFQSADADAELTLFNGDSTDAIVDLTILDANGRVAAAGSRGLVVRAGSSYSVPIRVMSTEASPIAESAFTIHVETSSGRVAAYLRERRWDGNDPVNAEWVPPAVEPAESVLLPGVPSGSGGRKVIIANPSERTARITVELLGPEGASTLPLDEDLEVAPESTAEVDLTGVIDEVPGTLRLTATNAEITAALLATTKDDVAYTAAIAPVSKGLWVVPATKDAKAVLQLANPTADSVEVQVGIAKRPSGEAEISKVTLPPESTISVDLPKNDITVVTLATESADLRAAIVASGKVGDLAGLTILPLQGGSGGGEPPQITLDPHVGS